MEGCNRHHLYWPRRKYKAAIERAFRNLPCHIVQMRIQDHRDLHATERPPQKPSREYMVRVLLMHREGKCPTCIIRRH
jgi:hypothetical protein